MDIKYIIINFFFIDDMFFVWIVNVFFIWNYYGYIIGVFIDLSDNGFWVMFK